MDFFCCQATQILDNSQEKLFSIHMISLDTKIIFFIILLLNTTAYTTTAYTQTGYAVRLKAVNNSGQCSTARPVTLRLMRSTHSVTRQLNAGKPVVLGVFTGEYKSVVTGIDSSPIESARLRVRPITCAIPFGCPTFMPATKQKNTLFSAMEFYNTTNDCIMGKSVSIAVNGQLLAKIGPGAHKRLVVPKGPAYMEIMDENQRIMMVCINPAVQPYEFYGCTDPKYPKHVKNGIVFSVKNSTETCGTKGGFPVILWIDGFPVRGVKPKTAAAIAVTKGQHRISISRKLTGKPLFERSMNLSKPFLFNYGCGKSK